MLVLGIVKHWKIIFSETDLKHNYTEKKGKSNYHEVKVLVKERKKARI